VGRRSSRHEPLGRQMSSTVNRFTREESRERRPDSLLSPFSYRRSMSGSSSFRLPTACWQLATAHPRRTPHVGGPAGSVYTGGHSLEIGPKILTFSHFSARPA
jgi:hypothetical protein